MPVIQTLDNQVQAQAAPNFQQRPLQNTGTQSLGEGVSNVGDVLFKVRQEEQLKADRAAFMDADRNTDTIQNDILANSQKLQLKDAIGLSPKAMEEFDKKVSDIETGLKTDRQKRVYRESINNRRASLQRQLDNYEGNEREKYYEKSRDDYKSQAHVNAVTQYQDPKAIEAEIDKIRATIAQTPGLDDEMRASELGVRRSGIYAGVIDRYLANDQIAEAGKYYESVKDRVNGDHATQIESRINAAKERQKNQRDASLSLARAELQDEVRNIEAAARLRLPVEAVPSKARFVALYGERGSKMYDQVAAMANLSRDAAKLDGMSTDDIVKLAEGYVPKAAGGDTAAEAERAGIIAQQAKAVLYTRQQDPVGYLQKYSPTVQAATKAFAENPNDQTRATYLNALRGERERLGIKGDEILSNDQVAGVIERASRFSDTQKLTDSVRAEAKIWGKDWPQVFMQASDKMPDVAFFIGSGLSDKASDTVAATAGLTDDEMKRRLPSGTTMKNVQDDVASDLEDFALSFPIEGSTAVAKMLKGVENLTIGYLGQGMSYKDARKAAVREVNDKYEFTRFRDRTYRVPVIDEETRTPIDADAIEDGATSLLKKVSIPDVNIPVGATKAQFNDVVRRKGYFVTNEDETGLSLFFNGAPTGIEYTWAQLSNASVAEPVKTEPWTGY